MPRGNCAASSSDKFHGQEKQVLTLVGGGGEAGGSGSGKQSAAHLEVTFIRLPIDFPS